MSQLDEQKKINMNIFEVLQSLQKKQEEMRKEESSGNISERLKSQTATLNRNQFNKQGAPIRLEGSLNNDFELNDKLSNNVTLPLGQKRGATRIGSIIHRQSIIAPNSIRKLPTMGYSGPGQYIGQ